MQRPSRNQSLLQNTSELANVVLEGAEIAGQIFDHPLQQWGNNKLADADISRINATSFSNQTSRFQPL